MRGPARTRATRSSFAAEIRISATTKPGTSAGRMPEKVQVTALASVTAGLANDVDEVNQ